jgi:hypothetical protein
LPTTHPLRSQFDNKNGRGEAGRFRVEQEPVRCFHSINLARRILTLRRTELMVTALGFPKLLRRQKYTFHHT